MVLKKGKRQKGGRDKGRRDDPWIEQQTGVTTERGEVVGAKGRVRKGIYDINLSPL